ILIGLWSTLVSLPFRIAAERDFAPILFGAACWALGILGCALATKQVMWLYFATERWTVTSDGLRLEKRFLGIGKKRTFSLATVNNVRVEEKQRRRGAVQRFVVFDYNGVEVCSSRPLMHDDAQALAAVVQSARSALDLRIDTRFDEEGIHQPLAASNPWSD